MLNKFLTDYENRTFTDIIDSISADQIKATHFLQTLPKLKEEAPHDPLHQKELNGKIYEMETFLSSLSDAQKKAAITDDTLTNIAYFARIIAQVHPGWEDPTFETKDFQKAVETLYRTQKRLPDEKRLKGRHLLKEFFKITATTLQDNHLTVKTHDGQLPLEEGIKKTLKTWEPTKLQHPDGRVGQNVALRISEEIKPQEIIALKHLGSKTNQPFLVAERIIKGQRTGIVAFPNSTIHWGSKDQNRELEDLNKILDTFKENVDHWDNVIIDVRNNHGGDGLPVREVAQTLYGNKVPYCLKAQKRDTDESQMRMLGLPEDEDYIGPALPFKGKKKGVYILVDREVASSAEAIVPMMRHYPGVMFIGENTCGCCQYGALRPVCLPNGGQINVGSVYRSYEDGMVECIGHKPDINCTGRDAFQEAIDQIGGKGSIFLHRNRDGIGIGSR